MRPKTATEVQAMRDGGRMLATVLDKLQKVLEPGMSGKDLSAMAAKELKSLGGQPSFLGYDGFPDVMCVSINEEIVHGLPNDKPIKAGDVVKLDFGVRYKGLVTDSAVTVVAGQQPKGDVKRLLQATERSLYAGIDVVKDSVHVGDIGAAVQAVLDKAKLGVIRELVGHGVGDKVHEAPNIPNYGAKGAGPALKSGMTICIEPMASLGDWPVAVHKNGSVAMKDGSIGAHFEHTLLVTDSGSEILTKL